MQVSQNSINCVMASVLTLSGRSRVQDLIWTNQRLYNWCFASFKHASLRRKSKYLLARNHDNVSEWSDMSIREHAHVVSVSWHYDNLTKCVGLVQSGYHHHLIECY